MNKYIIIAALSLGASLSLIVAQDGTAPAGNQPNGGPRPPGDQGGPGRGEPGAPGPSGERRGPREGGPGGPGGQRPVSPIIEALDLNKDGVIDADEIAKAPESLKKLDKNGDGKLTEDEYRPQRPGGGQGRPGGPGGPGRGGGQGGPGAGQQGGPGPAPGEAARPQRPELEK